MSQKNEISEATVKSVHEKMCRKVRRRKLAPRQASMPGRIVPKKTGNNDPTRGGNRVKGPVDEGIKSAVIFLSENITKKDSALVGSVKSFDNRDVLLKIVNHLIATRLGGWRQEGKWFVNESGSIASSRNWTINEEGRLVPKGKSAPVDYSIDWLYEVRSICQMK